MYRINGNNQQPTKPTFNVNSPFMGVLMVQLNHTMSIELQRFIDSVADVEDEVEALKDGLRDPSQYGVFVHREGPSFLVIRSFKGVVVVEMNQEMRELLIQFISDIEGGVDKIIWAFRLALENPEGRDAHNRRNGSGTHGKRRRIRGAYTDTDEISESPEGDYNDEYESTNAGGDFEDGYDESEVQNQDQK